MKKIIDIYNELCRNFPNQDIIKKEDIINTIGYEKFVSLARNLMICISTKDEDGIYWYEL